jgi:RNA polymerase sigma factor (sigma-70 family)
MARIRDPRPPRAAHLRLLPSAQPPQRLLAPVLRPGQPVTPAQDALLTAMARSARGGDPVARDLLWIAFAPRLEPALRRCARVTWQPGWVRRDGLPWEMEDVRQEAWLVFAELVDGWQGEGSFASYVTAYFPWRLHNAMRRLAPPRRTGQVRRAVKPAADCPALSAVERAVVLAQLGAALSAADAEVLRLRAGGARFVEIAAILGVSRRTISRRWARIRRIAHAILGKL